MTRDRLARRARTAAALLLALNVSGPGHAAPAAARPPAPVHPLKQVQRDALMQKARERFERIRKGEPEAEGEVRVPRDEPGLRSASAPPLPRPQWLSATRSAALPTNVRVNNTAGDAANSAQSEQFLGVAGSNILVAWNDGQGFVTGPDIQGYGYSTDGGQTFTDGGAPPKPAGAVWTSDPSVTVKENTGEFYYAGLIDPTVTTNGIGVVRATFSGSSVVWDTPHIAISRDKSTNFIDKEWLTVDPSSGNLYLTYTNFDAGGDDIEFMRSTDKGVTWSAPLVINLPTAYGLVQGSRTAVGPGGEVYVVWNEIGLVDQDFMMIRKSTDSGQSFAAEVQAAAFYNNYGCGAPGFNRERGIAFPSIAVDRSGGPRNGRVYLAWNESVNFYDDALGLGGNKSEVESNDTPATATSFTVGQTLRGSLESTSAQDYFSFAANQGKTYIFYCDSLNSSLLYTFRVFCTDGSQRLAFAGHTSGAPGQKSLIVWTAPTTGTYYVRMAGIGTGSGGYRFRTGVHLTGSERGRDQRDVFVNHSDNGTAWSAPTRVNNDPPYYDDWLPEVAVGGNGIPYVIWYDWRDSPPAVCGGWSHVYFARSDDGGTSWSEIGPVTDTQTDWTNTLSNIAPNQGDYLGLYANATAVYPCWADGRGGNVDVYLAVWPLAITPVEISLVAADALPDRVSLEWRDVSGEALSATVYRRSGEDDWTALGTIEPDGLGRLRFEDRQVIAGTRYGYRLGVMEHGSERLVGEVWVDVPVAARLALHGVRPNPARHEAWVSFSLPDAAPATLSVYDVSGRLVRTRALAGFGAGSHVVNLAAQGELPVGVYIVRLARGGEAMSARVTVVR